MQILRQLISEQLDPRHDRAGAAIAFFSPFDGYLVFVAYDTGSLTSTLFGDIDSPTVYTLARALPAHVIDMLERGAAHRKQIEESELLELAQELLLGRHLCV